MSDEKHKREKCSTEEGYRLHEHRRILARVSRMQQGNYGDCKPVGEGVSELRMFFGSGYRVYFGEHGNDWVVLLCGGDKSSQDDDITQAKVYWREYLSDAES
jgi:putative addiction module killer protein